MDPLSLKTRRVYATLSFVAFIIILPIVALYASGYRLSGFALVPTGGIHVSVPVSGVSILLNGEEQERSSLLQKSFFFDTLEPGSYVVQAVSDAHYSWTKTVFVESRIVTDVSVLAVTRPVRVRELQVEKALSEAVRFEEETATTTTRVVSQDMYDAVVESFLATTTLMRNTASTTPLAVRGVSDTENNISLVVQNGDLLVRWEKDGQTPALFCMRPSVCTAQFLLEEGTETVVQAEFFAGGALYATKESGVVFTEIENRQPVFSIPLYTTPEARFSIYNGTVYIEDAGTYFEVSGF